MKSKTQKKVLLIGSIASVFILLTLVVNAHASDYITCGGVEDRTWVVGGNELKSKVQIPGHVVYDDSGQGGFTEYAVYTYGKQAFSDYGWFTGVRVYFYLFARYYDYVTIKGSYNHFTVTRWAAPPSDLITWNGDMDYGSATPDEWQYSVGLQLYGLSFSTQSTTQGCSHSAHPQVNPPIQDSYRYLGYYESTHYRGHDFQACVKFQVHNDVAKQWNDGIVWEEPSFGHILVHHERIVDLDVKVKFEYYHGYALSQWGPVLFWSPPIATQTHILADGINPDGNDVDLTNLPLAAGSV
ncbi:MAG: hypothetical protein JW891_05240 [Candidatus Lokiarchaeota archaeon]|nr:hypothetical protein [Candidatus Lokiarchaeota archaeon]